MFPAMPTPTPVVMVVMVGQQGQGQGQGLGALPLQLREAGSAGLWVRYVVVVQGWACTVLQPRWSR